MKQDLNVWKKLYELSAELTDLKPWEHIWSEDFICIELEPNDLIYCTVMGKLGDCIGISLYEGEDGYADLCSISQEYVDDQIVRYVMYEQTCLTWYMGDRDEVPQEQRQIIKDLGLKFRGHNHWPYFLSFEKRFSPGTINQEQALKMALVLERLIDVLKEYMDKKIDVDFKLDEMIYAHKDDNKWIYESMSMPDVVDKFYPIELVDKNIFIELNQNKKSYNSIYIDFIYLNTMISDELYDKPVNALLFVVMDKKSRQVIHMEVLKPDDDEIEFVISFFIQYILQNGRPRYLYVRNPSVYCAVADICDQCEIELKSDNFGIVDRFIEGMSGMF